MLVFLPGQGEIRRTQALLDQAALAKDISVFPLYGELSAAEQDRAIEPSRAGTRKIVLATNIAETSLTIEGVRIVIDSGLERRARFNPATGMNRLETLRISLASANQRRGRAGRTQSGVCYRLWSTSDEALMQTQTPAEILESDLAPLALELAVWGVHEPQQLRFADLPPAGSFAQARQLLHLLGALDTAGKITEHGRALAALPLHPRLGHLLLKSREFELESFGADLASLLSERDLLRSRLPTTDRDRDVCSRIEALHGAAIAHHDIDANIRQRVRRSSQQLSSHISSTQSASITAIHQTGKLLALAYPDRIAQRRDEDSQQTTGRYLLSNGRGAVLTDSKALGRAEYLVVAQLDAGEREATIQLAAPISLDELLSVFADQVQTQDRIEWDARESAVIARREQRLGQLILKSQRLEQPDSTQVVSALIAGLRATGLHVLPWNAAATALRTRIEFARQHDAHAATAWPAVDDTYLLNDLELWLAPWISNFTRLSQLNQLDMNEVVLSLLDWNQQQRLNEIAPSHLPVPSGSRIAVDYSSGVPTLSVRLQEVFGLHTTPRIGGGHVPVVMELLSPARRPVQITQDLASFWLRGYHDVKKDLKGRYPKHYWPDDPLQAEATARAKPRGT
jgi:ATP-dependent helicase HrpB